MSGPVAPANSTSEKAPPILFFDEITDRQLGLVGGKGLNLARLCRAGLPVPPGFVLTTHAYQEASEVAIAGAIRAAYRTLGGGLVAVRSSATSEDAAETSFAGQQETYLGIEGEEHLLQAIRRCRESLFTERAVAYRQAMGIPEEQASMAVVVQRMVPADVAGVLFTHDPTDPGADRMLVEALWGLGEALVSGRVTPDRWTLETATDAVLTADVARKALRITMAGEEPVPADLQSRPCLGADDLRRLAELGRRVEAEYGSGQDIEWALAAGELFLLQSRPITAVADEREQVRQEEILRLRQIAEPEGTVWARYSVAEVLPEPLPLTWALWKQFMSGRGGYGRMYRELGFDPDPALDEVSVLDLIAGRPYFNLSRDARLYFRNFPQEYPFAKLKADPSRAIYPKLEANLARAPKGFLLKFVGVTRQMMAAEKTLERATAEIPDQLEREHFPRIKEFARTWRAEDLSRFSDRELLEAVHTAVATLFDDFASQSLKPSILAGLAIQKLEETLKPALGEAGARAGADRLLAGTAPEAEYDMAGALRALMAGTLTIDVFLERFGHRGLNEMELAGPRWREAPGSIPQVSTGPRETSHAPAVEAPALAALLAGKRVHTAQATLFLERARRFTGLREAAKHCLMLGYEVLRRLLLEMDRRHALHGGIFYLEPEELSQLTAGTDLQARIAERRKRRALALGLEAPRVLFSDDLEAIGRPLPPPDAQEALTGTGVSSGAAEGPALILRSPDQAPADAHDFILVCPSTDPGWVPLFLRARGVVLETGGVLSHGAIVAREFGLPAVANIADACSRFKTGQRLRIDGGEGKVWLLP